MFVKNYRFLQHNFSIEPDHGPPKVIFRAVQLAENARYFFSRPKESQLAAFASKQSQPISSRELLTTQFSQMKAKFANKSLPTPDFWGGFRIVPHQVEFWQGGEDRLHDRFEYNRQQDGSWATQRLMP